MTKTQYLEKHFGGTWKYDGFCSWSCNDDKRYVSRTSTCTCDDSCKCPVRYFLYGSGKPVEIEEWFEWQFQIGS